MIVQANAPTFTATCVEALTDLDGNAIEGETGRTISNSLREWDKRASDSDLSDVRRGVQAEAKAA